MLGPKPDAPVGVSYTPGPWTVTGGGVLIYSRPAKQEVGYAREVYMCRAEREANARLMAAAPELLEAARKALVVLQLCCRAGLEADTDNICDGDCDSCDIQATQDLLYTTIAKATGEGRG